MSNGKPIGEFTKKDWQRFIPGLAFFGIFLFGLGVYSKSKEAILFGLLLTGTAVAAGFVLHFFFGMKIISLRTDFKHK